MNMNAIHIGPCTIGREHPPFIIAELSGNHGQDLNKALRLVDAAAAAGAHAVKLQTYTPDTMTLDLAEGNFFIDDPNSLWKGQSLYALYQKAYTPWEWHEPLFERARKLGMVPFSTPFDASAVDFLATLAPACYKIASFENGDLPLIRKVAATGKPLLIATGSATLAELAETVETARAAGCRDLILLKCTSDYPAETTDANLATLPHLSQLFGCQVGVSDHTLGTVVPVSAVALGACVIEKHFSLDRAEACVDAAFSLEPDELASLVRDAHRSWEAVGSIRYGPSENERGARRHRRSLYITRDLCAGDRLGTDAVRAIRPGYGLPPKYLDAVLGLTLMRDTPRGTPITWDLFR